MISLIALLHSSNADFPIFLDEHSAQAILLNPESGLSLEFVTRLFTDVKDYCQTYLQYDGTSSVDDAFASNNTTLIALFEKAKEDLDIKNSIVPESTYLTKDIVLIGTYAGMIGCTFVPGCEPFKKAVGWGGLIMERVILVGMAANSAHSHLEFEDYEEQIKSNEVAKDKKTVQSHIKINYKAAVRTQRTIRLVQELNKLCKYWKELNNADHERAAGRQACVSARRPRHHRFQPVEGVHPGRTRTGDDGQQCYLGPRRGHARTRVRSRAAERGEEEAAASADCVLHLQG